VFILLLLYIWVQPIKGDIFVNYACAYNKCFSTIFNFLNDGKYYFVCLAECFIN
jgi:hypothetical protein